MKFDIVIPTKNEEKNIELLINDIKKQTLQPQRIIVADKSKDKTAVVAKKLGAMVVEGVDDGYIGRGRNNGVKASSSQCVVFLDADVRIPNESYFENIIREFTDKKLDIATTFVGIHDGNLLSPVFSNFYNFIKVIGAKTKNILSDSGTCMIVDTKSFKKVGGFNEEIKNSEDIELIQRFIKFGKRFDVIKYPIYTSARRFKNRNIFGLIALILAAMTLTIIVRLNLKKMGKLQEKLENVYGELGGKAPDTK
ncbi:MAG TPA: glycosyltransferase [Candidatus Dojkabacteria bacterium]|nr:glycosyltransferase [Candidatus Dojkabacteria bacterium]